MSASYFTALRVCYIIFCYVIICLQYLKDFVGADKERYGNCHEKYKSVRACRRNWGKRVFHSGEICEPGMCDSFYGDQ